MGGVTGQKNIAVAKAVGHQAAADPVFLAQHLVLKVGAHAQNVANALVAVDRIKLGLVQVQVVLDQPVLLAVNRKHGAAAARVHGVASPGRLAGYQAHQPGRADVGGLHALDDGCAFELGADLLAHL